MGHVKTTIRSLTTWAQIHDINPPLQPRLALAVNSTFIWKFAILIKFNWQLSNYSIRWPSSPDRMAGSGIGPLSSRVFEVIRWQVTTFQIIAGSSSIFSAHRKQEVVFMSRNIKLLISNWSRTREFSQLLQTGKLLLTFLTMVTRWSRSTSNFYALIGQNLTGEFMRKIYAASWNLFIDSWK